MSWPRFPMCPSPICSLGGRGIPEARRKSWRRVLTGRKWSRRRLIFVCENRVDTPQHEEGLQW